MNGGLLLQAVISGVAIGGVYALIGMGFSLCWALTKTYALAQGDTAIASTLLAVAVVVGTVPVATDPSVLVSIGIVALAVVIGGGLGAASYSVVVRPAARDPLTWSVGLLVLGLALRAAITGVFAGSGISAPDPLHLDLGGASPLQLPGGGVVSIRSIGVIVATLTIAAALDRILVASRWGKRVTASADNPQLAQLCGIDSGRLTLIAFAVAGAVAAIAGLLIAPGQSVSADSGVLLGIAGAATALLGRAGSPRLAVPAGLTIGVAQQLILLAGGAGVTISDLLPGMVLVAVALVRPSGLATLIRRTATS